MSTIRFSPIESIRAATSNTPYNNVQSAFPPPELEANQGTETPVQYLERTVFPTLLPGIEQLLKTVKRAAVENKESEDQLEPFVWLGNYLKHKVEELKAEPSDKQ